MMQIDTCAKCGSRVYACSGGVCYKCRKPDLMREFRSKYKEAGKCLNCGSINDRPGRNICQACKTYIAAKRRALRNERIKNRLCVTCASPLPERWEKTKCEACSKFTAMYNRAWKEKQKQKKENEAKCL